MTGKLLCLLHPKIMGKQCSGPFTMGKQLQWTLYDGETVQWTLYDGETAVVDMRMHKVMKLTAKVDDNYSSTLKLLCISHCTSH